MDVKNGISDIFEVYLYSLQSVCHEENLYIKKLKENFYFSYIIKEKDRKEGRSRGLSRNLQLSTSFAINFANLYLG